MECWGEKDMILLVVGLDFNVQSTTKGRAKQGINIKMNTSSQKYSQKINIFASSYIDAKG